jgi:hypothetical protein
LLNVVGAIQARADPALCRSASLVVLPQAHEEMTLRFIGPLGLSRGLLSFQWTRGISVPHTDDVTSADTIKYLAADASVCALPKLGVSTSADGRQTSGTHLSVQGHAGLQAEWATSDIGPRTMVRLFFIYIYSVLFPLLFSFLKFFTMYIYIFVL